MKESKPKKKGINGPNKGKGFEREIAKILSDWTLGEYKFERVPQSGGLRWKEENNVIGDIVPPAEIKFPVAVECKKHEVDWGFDRILKGVSEIWGWWKQVNDDCKRSKYVRHPWLIFTKNFRGKYIALHNDYFLALQSYIPGLSSVEYTVIRKKAESGKGYKSLVILSLEDFLSIVKLSDILNINLERIWDK